MLQIVCSFTAGIPNNSLLGSSSTNNLYTSDVEWKVPCQRIDNRYIWVLCPTISLFDGWYDTGKFNMGQVIETVLIQSNVLSGHLPIILWLKSLRSEDDEAFSLLAGVLVFYQDKDKRKLGWLYASCHHWIHPHGIGKTKNPYENVCLAGNLISSSINFWHSI